MSGEKHTLSLFACQDKNQSSFAQWQDVLFIIKKKKFSSCNAVLFCQSSNTQALMILENTTMCLLREIL